MGSARGVYKIVQVYYTLVNVPKEQRSQVDRMHLAMVFREKLLKKYSMKVIFSRLVTDLKRLEEGIVVQAPDHQVFRFGLLLYSADNLEAHTLSGLSCSFSSKSVCRVCHIQYEHLDDNIHDFDGDECHSKWSIQEYDSVVAALDENDQMEIGDCQLGEIENNIYENNAYDSSGDSSDDEDGGSECSEAEVVENMWGVKSLCPLNELDSFHCIEGFPFDLLHDLMEGVIAEDLLAIIRALAADGWFSIEEYNNMLDKFGWYSYEANDKPKSVPLLRSVSKLRGNAVSHWLHIRYFPMIIKKHIRNPSNSVLSLALKLNEITERITATSFYDYEADILGEDIVDYLDARKKLRLEYQDIFKRPKPKHHYMRCDLSTS